MPVSTLTAVPRDGALATLRPGDGVEGVFVCSRKERLTARTGAPYLALELRDRSGALPARLFRDADLQGGRFDAGELVRVSGRVVRFREQTQIELTQIGREAGAQIDPTEFLPVAYRDLDELDGFLEHLAREVNDRGYRRLLDELLADGGFRAEFRAAACTRAGHHAYLGGLLEHSVAVATLAQEPQADLHVAEQTALLARLDRGAVGELPRLADVVDDRGADQQVAVEPRRAGR